MELSATDSVGKRPAELGLWDAVSVIVGIVVGVSIFKAPPTVFSNVGTVWQGLVVWGSASGGASCRGVARCRAGVGLSRIGGRLHYLTRGFGPLVGFLFAWTRLAVILTGNIAALSYVFADYAVGLYAGDARTPSGLLCGRRRVDDPQCAGTQDRQVAAERAERGEGVGARVAVGDGACEGRSGGGGGRGGGRCGRREWSGSGMVGPSAGDGAGVWIGDGARALRLRRMERRGVCRGRRPRAAAEYAAGPHPGDAADCRALRVGERGLRLVLGFAGLRHVVDAGGRRARAVAGESGRGRDEPVGDGLGTRGGERIDPGRLAVARDGRGRLPHLLLDGELEQAAQRTRAFAPGRPACRCC